MNKLFFAILFFAFFCPFSRSSVVPFTQFEEYYSPTPEVNVDDVIKLFRGIFEAWQANNEDVKRLLNCTDSAADIKTRVIAIINEAQNLDPTNVRLFIEGIIRIMDHVENIIRNVLPCVDSVDDFVVLVNRIINLGINELLMRIYLNFITNSKKVNSDIRGIIDAFNAGDFYKIGYNAGDLVEILLFKPSSGFIFQVMRGSRYEDKELFV